ncbi:MAG: MmgE/PrpD family protein [Chloroflexi bacterium]|nr:MmgE/PrpD family protein [Chloroflexota bacterium]MCI0780161.1 MmgE/PrpD family protein [Chloroflexota bacterium]MCI0865956.1 MmgE/PrpD family protein [Chloroflexota bacterium]MCI0894168.1 MmgE/PrpD family protein [Chloroflexota bacterium]
MATGQSSPGPIIETLSKYMVEARTSALPADVARKTKHHILDTIGAMVSGATLDPGKLAIKYAGLQGGAPEAQVMASSLLTNAVNAALANGILAHADETDDSHAQSATHPGCAVVPAALAMAEKNNSSGRTLVNAVALGYDVGCRIMRALRTGNPFEGNRGRNFSSHAMGGVFGAAAAASACTDFNSRQLRHLLSYTAQQASGITSWQADAEHIEKAFDFAGMPARNGVTSATMVEAGFTGVEDVFEGYNNFFDSYSTSPNRDAVIEELGSRYEVMLTNIKKYCVGSPIQAPVDALLNIMRQHSVGYDQFEKMVAFTSSGESRLTGAEQSMPDINLRYLLAVSLLDGDLSFEAGHDFERMRDETVVDICNRIEVRADPSLVTPESPRQGVIELTTKDGQTFRDHVVVVHGAMENPLTTEELEHKERPLLSMVLGEAKSDRLIAAIWDLESLDSVRDLRPMLTP